MDGQRTYLHLSTFPVPAPNQPSSSICSTYIFHCWYSILSLVLLYFLFASVDLESCLSTKVVSRRPSSPRAASPTNSLISGSGNIEIHENLFLHYNSATIFTETGADYLPTFDKRSVAGSGRTRCLY